MDIRSRVGKPLKHFTVTQGSCYGDGFIFMSFEQKENKKEGRKQRIKIVKMKANKAKTVVKVSEPLNIGHSNDMCYRDGVLYITHSGSSKLIHCVDADTLKPIGDRKITGISSGGFNGITCYGKYYMVKKMHSRSVYILDTNFHYNGKKKRHIKLQKKFLTSQGICWHNGKLHQATSSGQSTKNCVNIYNVKGARVGCIRYKHKCEMEGVFFIDNKEYITIHKKYKKHKKTQVESYIRRLV